MAEQTFKSPGFFDTETVRERNQNLEQIITTVPAGIAGFSEKGPAFVPTTVHSYERFVEIFGEANPEYPSTLAAKKFLENRDALTFVRVLGAGANTLGSHFTVTERLGTVEKAGFVLTGSDDVLRFGNTQFLCAEHTVATNEATGYPMFATNNTTLSDDAMLVRGILFTTTGSKFTVLNHTSSYKSGYEYQACSVTPAASSTNEMYKKFKLILTCSDGGLETVDGQPGSKIFSASLDPASDSYISKILNTDPSRFQIDKHLLYAHFPIEKEIAEVATNNFVNANAAVALLSGSSEKSQISNEMFSSIFGNYQARYTAPKTTNFISQPFGDIEYDLFHFECIDDGRYANDLYKISISKIKRSNDPSNPYPSFNVELRNKRDIDSSLQIVESYIDCDLNPDSDNFIAKKIGDMKLVYNFDTEDTSERRILVKGTYPNVSSRIRVVLSEDVINENVPKESAPFGFRGIPLLKTFNNEPNTTNLDKAITNLRFLKPLDESRAARNELASSILPPLPFRFKVTTGEAKSGVDYTGEGSLKEGSTKSLYWGIKFEKVPSEGDISNPITRANESIVYNDLLDNFSKFQGILKLDALITGSGADDFHHNKFSLSKVALGKFLLGNETLKDYTPLLTGSARDLMKDAAYIRNASLRSSDYTFNDSSHTNYAANNPHQRITFASLMSLTSSVYFNRFTDYAKFTNMFYGGFDGTNILDKDMSLMNDRASSADAGGKGVDAPNVGIEMSFGSGDTNATVNSYKEAVNLLTDPAQSRINLLCIPGIRSDELLSHAIDKVENYSKALLLMDVPHVDANSLRLYDDSSEMTNVRNTVESFDGRNYDTSYAAAYFPDVVIEDNGKRVKVPATVAAICAIGYNDNTSFPWFAPAGFNRGALNFVKSSKARLNKEERDVVYEGRINPISTFPKNGYVIFGQKTLQRARTSLDRVNVRRMLLEVKRVISDAAIGFIFEANTPEVRSAFKKKVDDRLITVQENQGIDQFKVIIDSTNNTQTDIDNNVLNGRIVLVPTRTIEFISIDFVISNSGVDFV